MAENKLIKDGVEVFDGQFILKLSKDRMRAALLPRDQMDEIDVNQERLKVELEGQGVVYGILDKPEPTGKGSFYVAKGKPPAHGEDAKVKMHVKPSVVRAPKMKDPDKDQVDYRELGNVVNVSKDKLLLEKILATEGTPGKDVFGKDIPAKPGKDRKLKGGPGVYFSDDEMKVFAKFDGKFLMADGKPSVYSEHSVTGDVDLSVGNIAFGGTELVISGEVLPGFSVKCRGNVSIGKGVNNATVMAGGNLSVRGGTIGEDAALRAKGDISVDFVENGPVLETSENLHVNDFIVQGKAKVGKKMTALKGKGTIIGGKYVIGGSMYVKELGSDAEIATEVSVGIVPALQAKKQKLEEELALWSDRMNELIKNISALEKMKKDEGGKLSEEKSAQLEKYKSVMPKAMDRVNNLTEMNKAMEEELEQMVNECVYVYGTLYPGVSVRIGSALRTMTAEEEQVVVHFDKTSRQIFVRKMSRQEREEMEQ